MTLSTNSPYVFNEPIKTILALVTTVARVGYAFTASDLKTIIMPVTCFAILNAPSPPSPLTVFRILAWSWIHLLQFNTANQAYSPAEDAANKPYRPIPSGMMTVKSTYILRWALVPICLYHSWTDDVLLPSLILTVSFAVFNEGGLHYYWQVNRIIIVSLV
ncbi:hypothetical protein PQX77_006031 [Marasmius sp. AFHP31]|nr:hypothetical protein PQX77_006031 [Marasmius sp. AFHP31]